MLTLTLLLLCSAPKLELRASLDGGAPEPGWVYAKAGQTVDLVAVTTEPATSLRWFKLEPTIASLDNTSPSFHFEPVPYAKTPMPSCDDARVCRADIAPTRLPERLPGLGTMAFQVEATFANGETLRTPGFEAMKYGGLTAQVMRVTIRRDDTLLGYATELANTPYIFGSAGPDGRNQSDLLIGSDCADLIIYARRRSGRAATYTSSYALDQQAPPLPAGAPVQAGDIVHFPAKRHVGYLYQDNPPLGVLDESDLLLHTCWDTPKIEKLGEVGACASAPWRVLRFAEPKALGARTLAPNGEHR